MSAASLAAVRRARPARVLQVMAFGVAFLFAAAHITGGLGPGSSRLSVPDEWRADTAGRSPVTTPSGATRTHRFASDAVGPPKVIRSVVARSPRSPSSPRSPPPSPNAPPPPRSPSPPRREPEAVASTTDEDASSEDAEASSSTRSETNLTTDRDDVAHHRVDFFGSSTNEYDERFPARRAADRFQTTCGETDAFFAAAGARYEPGSLSRDPSLGVLIVDWSENHFNGIGDEMQHYQEMLAIGLGTGRAAYLQTQPRACRGTGLGGSPAPPSVKHVVEACRFDLGDFFTGIRGVDWRWDGEKERKVADELGVTAEAFAENELVVTWSPKGMYYQKGRDAFKPGEARSPTGAYVAPPDANFIEVMLSDPVVRESKVVRIRVKQSFGHWCHPHQRGDWGMCASYRWIAGVRDPENQNKSAPPPDPSPCPSCFVGGCFGFAIAHPRDFLKHEMAPYLRTMEQLNWTVVVAAHVRTGFADVSAVAPPETTRRENATLAGMDAFLAEEAARVPFPDPTCPDVDIAARNRVTEAVGPRLATGGPSVADAAPNTAPNASRPLSSFLRCVAATGRALAKDAPWGVFLMTDAPGVRAVVDASAKELGIPGVLATDGAYGHVKAGNTGVCAEAREKNKTDACDASDPRGAWLRSMADMALMGFADIEVMLFQSKFGAAASMRAAIPHGLREFYRDARLTHSLVAPLADEMASRGGKVDLADETRARAWTRVWDLFGPAGERGGLRTSRYAVGSVGGA